MASDIHYGPFIWNEQKSEENAKRHGLGFEEACQAFLDHRRLIEVDEGHSETESRYFCIGRIGEKIATVRFTYRGRQIRIFGAGFWRKGRKRYETEN